MPLESEVLQTTVRMWLVESDPIQKQVLQMRARAIASTNEAAVAELHLERSELSEGLKQILTIKEPHVKVNLEEA